MADTTSFGEALESLSASLLGDGSFVSFFEGLDELILDSEEFADALNGIDSDLLTDGRFTRFLTSRGPEIILDGSFVEFTSLMNRGLLSDGSFSTFLNQIDKSVLTNGGFTKTLLSLEEGVLGSGNFTEALLSIDDSILKTVAFQDALTRIDIDLLTSDAFDNLFRDGLLPGIEDSIEIRDGGAIFVDGVEVSGQDIADAILEQLLEVQESIQDAATTTVGRIPPDSILTGGGTNLQSESLSELNTNFVGFGGSTIEADVDTTLREFITGEGQSLSLTQPVEEGLSAMSTRQPSSGLEAETLLSILEGEQGALEGLSGFDIQT